MDRHAGSKEQDPAYGLSVVNRVGRVLLFGPAALALISIASAQSAGTSVWDGVFTDEQTRLYFSVGRRKKASNSDVARPVD